MKSRVKPFRSPLFTRCLVGCASLFLSLVADAQTIPNAPTNLTASAGSLYQINLSWSDTSTNETGFKVERSLDGTNFTQTAQVLPNTTNYLNNGLFPDKTYFYRVRAYNAGGNSTYTGVANASTPALCPLSVVGWGWNYSNKTTAPFGLTNIVKMAVGYDHNLILKLDGTVVGWGDNTAGAATPPTGLTGVTALSAGLSFSLALKSDGTVVGWGDNSFGQTTPPVGLSNVTEISAGQYHGLALRSDGTVVGWGYNGQTQATPPAGLAGVVAIAAGAYHSLALKSDGTVVGWGYDYFGEATTPTGLAGVVAIAADGFLSLALKSDGTVVGWGYNESGEATPPAGLSSVVAIAAGYWHSLALKSDGTVVSWGDNYEGATLPPAGLANVVAIGAGNYDSLVLTAVLSNAPAFTASATSASQVNLSWIYNANNADGFKIERAPNSGGNPGAWTQIVAVAASVTNFNDTGLTTNTTYWYRIRAYNSCVDSPYSTVSVVTAPPPAPLGLTTVVVDTNLAGLSWVNNFADVSGFEIERALDNGGSPGTWTQIATVAGAVTTYTDTDLVANTTYWYRVRAYNGLGDSPYTTAISVITVIPDTPSNFMASAASPFQIKLSWSDDSTNKLGFKIERSLDGTNFTQIAQVSSNTTIYGNTGLFPSRTYYYRLRAYNSAGGHSAFAGVASATTFPLCDTTVVGWGRNDEGQTTPPAGLTGAVAIGAGYFHGEALESDGTVVGWGSDYYATPPAGLTGVVAVSVGIIHNLALKSDGTVVAWGDNYYGESAVPGGLSNVVAVAAGYQQSLALKSDGTVVAWGSNTYGAVAAPAGLSNVVAISAGGYHNLALKSDGTVVAWGDNYYGQSNVPSGLTGVIAIAAGGEHSLALKSDGTVVGWGDNYFGQNTPPPGLTNVLAVAAGWTESLALKSDGTVVGYGYNSDGQTTPPPGLTGVVAISAGVYHSLALSSVPGAPPSLTLAAVSANQVNLSWNNTAGTVAGFKIERAPDSSGSPGSWTQIVAVAGTVTSYSDTGLTTNTTYWYRMQAYNVCTNSAYTVPINVIIAPPPAPLNLTAVVIDTNQVNLSWINNYADVAGFTIERALDSGGSPGTWIQIATVAGSVTSYTDTEAVANTTYWYRVHASNGLGDSPDSDQVIGSVSGGQLITVMQWNIHGSLGNIGNNNSAGARAIARIVNYNQPDVLLLNEIDTQGLTPAANTAAMIDWVTNNVAYLGSQTGVTFWVAMSSQGDGFIRNGAISRYPILAETTYDDGLRGLHSFRVQLNGTNALQVFHAHIKCCSDDCARKHSEAQFDADTISGWAATNSLPYIFGGDWNDDEESPLCGPPNTITTIREGSGLVEFKPTTLDGEYRTWSTSSVSIRFDYLLAASNRLSAVSGYVFSTMDWAAHGLYTDASPQNLVNDSQTASDHFCVFAKYSFPSPGFPVTPTNAFASAGYLGGPFSPAQQVYTLSNTNSIPLHWSVTKSASWLAISATNGILLGGASTNITVSISATANSLPVGAYADTIGLVSVTINASLAILWPPPVAGFTGSPTNGMEPVTVIFTDTSTGPITARLWDFGDGATTNIMTNVVVHTYSAGGYAVQLIVSGPGGVSTNTKPNYITVLVSPSTFLADAGNLFDRFGTLAPSNSVAVLVVDTGNNGFVKPQPSFPLSLGATWGNDDKVVGLWDLTAIAADYGDGQLYDQTVVACTNGIAPGQKLQLYWFPSLTLASNTVGVTYYGKYADTNNPALDGSDAWQMPSHGTNVHLKFWTAVWGGSNPETAGEATLLTATPLTSFQSWQIQYFGDTNNAAAAASADPDGDGQNNMAEFLAGTNPTNSLSGLRIISAVRQTTDVVIVWTTAGGVTNAFQATASAANDSYTTNFTDISGPIMIQGSGDVTTNYTDTGGATNTPSRYYRIRLVP